MKCKHIAVIVIMVVFQLLSPLTIAQETKQFTVIKENWASPYKSQGETGLCAIYSDISFLESELHRLEKGDLELSTMNVAYNFYIEKALRRIRLRGKKDFGFNGGFNYDAFEIIKKYGIVQLSDYTGLLPGQTEPHHFEFINQMHSYLDNVEKEGKEGKLNSQWKNGKFYCPWLDSIKQILNQNMGVLPTAINYNKKKISPIQFSEEVLSIPYDNYIKITSYSYLGFDQKGELLVDGNWLHKKDFYNVRIDDFINLIDYALENGFTLTGDFDITKELYENKLGVEYGDFQLDSSNTKINQDIRDNLYENWKTNDVHNVHIIGIARDEKGNKYYKIKDSVPQKDIPNSPKYFSENFFRAKVLSVMLNKDGIPSEIRKGLNIN